MQTPFFLPEELDYCRSMRGSEELFSLLQHRPLEDMVAYFEAGAKDHTWTKNVGGALMQQIFIFFNELFFQQKMPQELALRVAAAVQENFVSFQPYLKEDFTFIVEKENLEGSSLMFGALSSFFGDLIARQAAMLSGQKSVPLLGVSPKMFKWIKEYLYTGQIELLWREEPEEILEVIHRASRLNLDQMAGYASSVFRRYINKENVVSYFMWGRQYQAKSLSEECCLLMGTFSLGFEVFPNEVGDLEVKIESFNDDGLVILQQLANLITTLRCRGKSAEDPRLTLLLPRINRLNSFDLSETSGISLALQDLFPNVRYLSFSHCDWLEDNLFVLLATKVSRVTNLELRGDVNLSFRTWGALASLPSLSDLNLSQCTQIGDDDLDLIAASCSSLTLINLSGCTKITDTGIRVLSRQCLELVEADMTGLSQLSEQGIIDFALHAPRLRSWTLKKVEGMTPKALQQIAFVNPTIKVIQ